mmetsp:Transcript_15584/g.54123  ORF Transcript_15584/g.54123 Transcript_15584/m.54123 type:complete len:275 (+) Transcript_15584:968-1792(+)
MPGARRALQGPARGAGGRGRRAAVDEHDGARHGAEPEEARAARAAHHVVVRVRDRRAAGVGRRGGAVPPAQARPGDGAQRGVHAGEHRDGQRGEEGRRGRRRPHDGYPGAGSDGAAHAAGAVCALPLQPHVRGQVAAPLRGRRRVRDAGEADGGRRVVRAAAPLGGRARQLVDGAPHVAPHRPGRLRASVRARHLDGVRRPAAARVQGHARAGRARHRADVRALRGAPDAGQHVADAARRRLCRLRVPLSRGGARRCAPCRGVCALRAVAARVV